MTESPTSQTSGVPQAIIRPPAEVAVKRMHTRLWWLTGVCAILAVVLIVAAFKTRGQIIFVRFLEGHGLKAGDTLRYRGIDVGSVKAVSITSDLQAVDVEILLAPGNEKLAVEGSQFWIQRARLRLGQLSGLDTVLGAKYVGVLPGEPQAEFKYQFIGIEAPLAISDGDSIEIGIRFPAGEGLEVGDPIRFRGIAVGEITFVELSDGLDSVSVGARLVGAARQLARAGTQFWIERPRLDLTEIRGLETILGGRYIAMQPMSMESEPRTEFVGLAEPPPLPRRPGSLEIELDAPSRLGLVRGAPVTYRGLEVGRVSNVGLASDGASVKIGAIIDTEFTQLMRDNSKWWAVGGIEFDVGLGGVHVSIESLSSWVRGGIAFATPLAPGQQVVTGHRFMLEPEPQEEWLEWQPRIAMRNDGGNGTAYELPQAVRVVASWQASWLGLYRRQTAQSWGVVVDENTLLLPASFVKTAIAADSDVSIEVGGKSFAFDAEAAQVKGEIAQLRVPTDVALGVTAWPRRDIDSSWSSQTVLLVVNPELSEPLAIDGTRITEQPGVGLKIAPGVAIAAPLNGSPVINSKSGKLVGLLVASEAGWVIAAPQ